MSERQLRGATGLLSTAGVGVAGYLTYVHYAGLSPVCGVSHGCETVQTSQYASLAGVPVALLGLLAYIALLATTFSRSEVAWLAGVGISMIGFAVSAYLTYREVFTIHAICSWCVSSAVIFTLLAGLSLVRAVVLVNRKDFTAATAEGS